MVALYGIKTCDTVRKARAWLDARSVAYTFHDFKAEGAAPDRLAAWAGEVGWERLLNRAGTTFRQLGEDEKAGLDEAKALALMAAKPTLIKRPVVEGAGDLLVGFKPETYEAAFG
ncbi:arsenate reductase [Methylopila musalis]|uniref:Arsenate reductase n=1 Tax=Methylopila musalis TaxID=1134781 RepID=A0ABW3Z698_9HYPH